MKAIVTGSTGFIGYHLVRKLIDMNVEVHCLVRRNSNIESLNKLRVEKHLVDYLDNHNLLNISAFNNVDYIFHVAGITKGVSKKQFFDGNVIPTLNILNVIKNKNIKLKRFILLSSIAVYGPTESINKPLRVDSSPNPIEYYGISKLEAEKILEKYKGIIPYTIIRAGAVYGPKDLDFLNLFKLVSRYGLEVYFDNCDSYFSIIYVDDLVEGIIAAAFSENTIDKCYNLVNDAPISWSEFYKIISQCVNKQTFKIYIPSILINLSGLFGTMLSFVSNKPLLINMQKLKLFKQRYWICSNYEAKKDFGFRSKSDIERGINETYKWYKENNLL